MLRPNLQVSRSQHALLTAQLMARLAGRAAGGGGGGMLAVLWLWCTPGHYSWIDVGVWGPRAGVGQVAWQG